MKKKSLSKTNSNIKIVALSFGALLVGLGSIVSARILTNEGPRKGVSADVYGNCGTVSNRSYTCTSSTNCVQCIDGLFNPSFKDYCPKGSLCNPYPNPSSTPTTNCSKAGEWTCINNSAYQCDGRNYIFQLDCKSGWCRSSIWGATCENATPSPTR